MIVCARLMLFTCPAVPATTSLLLYLQRLIFWMPSLGSSLYGSKQPTYRNAHELVAHGKWKRPSWEVDAFFFFLTGRPINLQRVKKERQAAVRVPP